MTRIREAERLATALERIDRKIMDGVSAYSHAAAGGAAREAWAAVGHRRDLTGIQKRESAATNAERIELEALDHMMELVTDDDLTAQRKAAVAALEAAGLTSGTYGGWAHQRAGRAMIQAIRNLGVCRSAITNGTNPAYGRDRGAELVAELTAMGVDCEGYMPHV